MAEAGPSWRSGADEGEGLAGRLAARVAWLQRELWLHDSEESWALRFLRSSAQLVALTMRGFQTDQLLLRASALTYVTALSVIPMLAVVIAILGIVGGDETLVEFAIDQLTTVAPEVRETVRGYAAGVDFRSFGTIGGAVVFGMAIFALRHLEATLNDIWGVVAPRSWARRFSDYLAVMVVAPVSTGVAVSLATTLQSGQVVGWLLEDPLFARIYGLGLAQVPVLVLFAGFTFLFWFFPNTEVRIRAAALGGAVAAILFATARTVYVEFQIGAATYQAVFGALSAVPLILAWLYACWAVLLLGAEVAFAAQNLAFARREMRAGDASVAEQEVVALEIAVEIGSRFRARLDPPNAENLADALDAPIRLVRRLCEDLERADLLRSVQSGDGKDAAYMPAAPLRDLTLGAVLRALRGSAEGIGRNTDVARTLDELEGARSRIADETTLESLCTGRESPNADPNA
ncbi:MAG: YihY/virulence factor BrkB family protein [bacterium]|nr:hypothetical protein [Deltaproteobacteria bacterium]MCP4908389.1 YihY/virulence factor BrkB family protein [bacterium]